MESPAIMFPEAAAESEPPVSPSSSVGSSPKKRSCEESTSPLSNKRTKEAHDAEEPLPDADGIISDANMKQSAKRGGPPSCIDKPGDYDCFLGGKMLTDQHQGNINYRQVLNEKRPPYKAACVPVKFLIVNTIIRQWRSQGGRFFMCTIEGWEEALCDKYVNSHTCNALCLGSWGTEEANEVESNINQSDNPSKEWPLRNINMMDATDNDACFSMKGASSLPGNQKYQQLLASKKALYLASKRKFRPSVAMDVIREWRAQDPPGRFLRIENSCFRDVGDEVARKTICKELGKGSNKKHSTCNGTLISLDDEDQGGTSEIKEDAGALVPMNLGNKGMKLSAMKRLGVTRPNMIQSESEKNMIDAPPQKKVSTGEKENVRPYPNGSKFSDVLSFFASTPFDPQSMISLHAEKECSIQMTTYIQRTTTVLPSRASLPIVPQKQFLNSKASAMGDVSNGQESPKGLTEKEVLNFLLEEARYLVNKALPAQKKHSKAAIKGPSIQKNLPQCSAAESNNEHSTTVLNQPSKNAAAVFKYSPLSKKRAKSVRSGLDGSQSVRNASISNDKKSTNLANYPNNSSAAVSKPGSLPNGANTSGNGLDESQSIPNASIQANSTDRVLHYPVYHSNNYLLVSEDVMASKEKKSLALNVQTAAKIPVGYHLNDNATSVELASAAADNPTTHGDKAAKSKGTDLRVSVGATNGSKACKTPEAPKTPSIAPQKTPNAKATLLSTRPAPNLPEGWVLKTFKRTSGRSTGSTDKYFFSPKKEIKFRSIIRCMTFIEILNEPGIDGNEKRALKLYKERGHKC